MFEISMIVMLSEGARPSRNTSAQYLPPHCLMDFLENAMGQQRRNEAL
jgi:hypothetical protein